MALNPSTKYPGQILTSDPAGYPYGRPRNETTPGDRNGTPFEADWLSDLYGFEQALLTAAGIAPSGVPDKVGASQYLAAIRSIASVSQGFWMQSGLGIFDGAVQLNAGATVTDLTASGQITVNGPFESHGTGLVTGTWAFVGSDPIHINKPQFSELPILQPSLSVRVPQPLQAIHVTAGWTWNTGSVIWQTSSTGNIQLPVQVVPNHSTVTAIRFTVIGSGFTTLPSNMPEFDVRSVNSGGVVTDLLVDSVALGTFNSRRIVTVTLAAPLVIDHSSDPPSIYARISYNDTGAAGASRVLRLERLEAVCTATRVNP
jgi:hypothetical protein